MTTLAMVAVVAMGSIAVVGCGEDDPCATKTCEFGTCSSDDGRCVNMESCQVDKDCVPGYLCGDDNTCVAQNTCSADADCDVGICRDGACVNPSECTQNGDCLPRTYCGDDGSCKADPCNETSCRRGVCQRGTDNCVSADSCTEDTEVLDCIAGEKCANGSCEPRDSFCENVTCDRGVCDFDGGGCINAPDCDGDDSNCREGFFCNDMNQCAPNLCVRNQVDCQGDGVCRPATGTCENAMSCESNSDCVDSPPHLCVDNTCVLESAACGNASGDGGCPGNQLCEYESESLTATCAEPENCETSIDCLEGRQCGGSVCIEAVSCRPDDFEPNNAAGEATVFTDVDDRLTVQGRLCQGDTDIFEFDTSQIIEPTSSGTIVADVTIPKRAVGLGELSMRLLGPDGNEIGSTSLGAMGQQGSARLTHPISIPDQGVYTVEITTGDEMTSAGLGYDLSINIPPQSGIQSCSEAPTLTPGQRVSGNTDEGANSFGASCMTEDETSPERVFELQLEKAQEVRVEATPITSEGDPVVSLRRRCTESGTELACSNATGGGESESVQRLLSAGSYYVIVQPADGESLGNFALTADRISLTTCGPQDNHCSDGQTANICSNTGGRFSAVSCTNGCNPMIGGCFPPVGDTCGDEPSISKESMSKMRTIDLRQFNDNYSLSSGGCIEGEPRTGGADATYSVTIPANTTMTASVSYGAGASGALYIVDDCSDVGGTCQKGTQSEDNTSSEEEIFFSNTTDSSVTKKLIIDTAADQTLGQTDVSFTYEDIVCPPGGGQCLMNGNREICNPKGTAYTGTETCDSFACDGGFCPGDTCAAPYNVTQEARNSSNGVTYGEFNWGDFADDYRGGGCGVEASHTEGTDMVLQADLQAGEVLNATVYSDDSSPLADPSIYIQDTCGALSSSTCLAGQETNDETASATFYAKTAQTVFIFGDADDKAASEEISMEVNIAQTVCTPSGSSCSGGDVQTCASDGLSQGSTYSCSSGCTGGFCNNRDSEYCWDAENITSQLKSSGGFSRTIDWSNFSNDLEQDIPCGDVDDFENDGQDAVYVVDLQPNETLSMTLDPQGSSADAGPYIIRTCEDPAGTCLAGDDPSSGPGTVSFTANQAETVFVVADHGDGFGTPSDFLLTGDIQ